MKSRDEIINVFIDGMGGVSDVEVMASLASVLYREALIVADRIRRSDGVPHGILIADSLAYDRLVAAHHKIMAMMKERST
jgi:hypothetical protein